MLEAHEIKRSIQTGNISLAVARCSCGFVTSGKRHSLADRRKMDKQIAAHLDAAAHDAAPNADGAE